MAAPVLIDTTKHTVAGTQTGYQTVGASFFDNTETVLYLSDVKLALLNPGGATGTVTITLNSDDNGSPGASLGTLATIDVSTLPTSGTVLTDIPITGPFALAYGTEYWIEITNSSSASFAGLSYEADGGGTGTTNQYGNDGSQVFPDSDGAFIIKVSTSFLSPPCFAAGTGIATAGGPVAVETLAIGDIVLTAEGGQRPVRWLGHRRVICGHHPDPRAVWPVRVAAGAFAPGQPGRDLWLSPDHAVFAGGVLIPVKHLVNGATIAQVPVDHVTYWHVELDAHDAVLAEGLPCESYLDNGTRRAFANGGVIAQLHPDFSPAERCEAAGEMACAPQRIAGAAFNAVDDALRARATALGYAVAAGSRAPMPAAVSPDLADLLQADWYLAQNPDVAVAGMDAAVHYAAHGRREGRLPCPEAALIGGLGLIDPATVMRTMPDVAAAGADLAAHYCTHGWREQRRPNAYFDPAWYGRTARVPSGMNPLLHYVLFGETQGLAPSRHFDPAWYRRHYALTPSICVLAHYLCHRRTQNFSPLPSFDVAAYAAAHPGTLRPGRDAYMHFLLCGQDDDRRAA